MAFIKQLRSGPMDALIPKQSPTFPTSSTIPTDIPPRKTHTVHAEEHFLFSLLWIQEFQCAHGPLANQQIPGGK